MTAEQEFEKWLLEQWRTLREQGLIIGEERRGDE